MLRNLLPPAPAGRPPGRYLLAACTACLCLLLSTWTSAQNDLSIFRVTSDVYVERGDLVYFTYVVTNDLGTDVDGIGVRIDLPPGLAYVSHFPLSQNFDPATGRWSIGDIRFFEPQRIVTLELRVQDEGVLAATAEITAMSGTDIDSDPGNGALDEDDLVSACVSVPIRAECGQSVALSAPGGYTDYRWYLDGTLIPGATTASINVGESGSYNYQVGTVTSTCPLGSCCSALVTFDSVSVTLSQSTVCTGGFDTVRIALPEADSINFDQAYTWASIDDPSLSYLSCDDCRQPRLVVDGDYLNSTIRYTVDVVTTDPAGNVVCGANANIELDVLQAPVITFAAPDFACVEDCITLQVTTDLPTTSIVWEGPNLNTLSGPTVQYCPQTTSEHRTETFVVGATGLDGCLRVDSVAITTLPRFEVIASADQTICQNLPAEISISTLPDSVSADSLSIAWSEDPGNPNAGGNLLATTGYRVSTDSLAPGSYRFRASVSRVAPDGSLVCATEAEANVEVDDDCARPHVGGYVWLDENGDGLRQPYELPLENVRVQIFRDGLAAGGAVLFTDNAGFYSFEDLAPGGYRVQFEDQAAFNFSPQNVGGDEFIDSDADATGLSDLFVATYDESVNLVGAGYIGDCQLAVTNVATSPSDCGRSDGALGFDVGGGVGTLTITWSPNVSNTTFATGLPAGSYAISIFDDATSCGFDTVLVVPGTSNYSLTSTSTPAACGGGSGGSITLLTDGGTAPFSVVYNGPDAATEVASAMPYTISELRGGYYEVAVTDAAGCLQRTTLTVAENPLALALDTADVLLASCNGGRDGSFEVEVSGFNDTYDLTLNGQLVASNTRLTRVPLTGQAAGRKELRMADDNGCVQTYVFELLDEGPAIDPATLVVTQIACFGEASGAIASTTNQQLELRNSAGQSLGLLPQNNLFAGSYTLVDRTQPGCLTTRNVRLTQPRELRLDPLVQGSDCDGPNGTIDVSIVGGTKPYSISWNRGLAADSSQTGLAAGNYEVTVADAQGCTAVGSIAVPDFCEPVACKEYFTADTLVIETDGVSYDWCFANFDLPTTQRFELDGQPIDPDDCSRGELVYYNLASLPGDGADGPYVIEFFYGGDAIVIAEQVADARGFAEALDRSDAWGRWRYDAEENTVTGGQPGRAYGEIEVTHLVSGKTVYLTPQTLPNQASSTVTLGVPGGYDFASVGRLDGCRDSVHVIVRPADACSAAFRPDDIRLNTPYCDQPSPVCLDVPFELMASHTLSLNGAAYAGPVEACNESTDVYYDLGGFDLSGEILLEGWRVDGRFFNARVASVEELAARMTYFDNEAWSYDASLGVLRGGDTDKEYLSLRLRLASGREIVQPQRDIFDGTRIEVLAGSYRAELASPGGCTKIFWVTVGCSKLDPPSVDTVRWTVGIGFADTLCLSTEELPGFVVSLENICPDAGGEKVAVRELDDVCFLGEGVELGVDTLCVRVCDVNGVCDTTIVLAEAVDPADLLFPVANPDKDSVLMDGELALDLLANDLPRGELTSLEVIRYPRQGRIKRLTDSLTYVPRKNYCGIDSMVYEICNGNGCDTARVDLYVKCDGLIIFSGFSPNFDDVNETFTVLGVGDYPGNNVKIYNRWGNRVFDADDYDNSWRGTYYDGSDLPEGTYYYVFEDGKGRTYTGYCYLKR